MAFVFAFLQYTKQARENWIDIDKDTIEPFFFFFAIKLNKCLKKVNVMRTKAEGQSNATGCLIFLIT